MARRVVSKRDGFPEVVETQDDVGFVDDAQVEHTDPVISFVKVICNRDGLVKVFGDVTGTLYEFRDGVPVMVDKRDLPVFERANKVVIQSCCGSIGSPKFLIEEA